MKNNLLGVIILFVLIAGGYWVYQKTDKGPPPMSWGERDAEVASLQSEMKKLAEKIESLQGASKCRQDLDCRVVGLGPRECEGYKDFLIYSVLDSDEEPMLAAVKQFNERAEKVSDFSLQVQSCGMKPSPIHCRKSKCVPEPL